MSAQGYARGEYSRQFTSTLVFLLPLYTQESSEDSEDYDPTQEEQGLPEEEDVGLSEEEEEGGEGPSSSKRPRLDPDPPPPVSSDSD